MLAIGGGLGGLLLNQLHKRGFFGGSKPVEAPAGTEEVTASGGSSNVSMNDPESSTDVGTKSNPSQEEVPLWVKNQAYIQGEVDKGTGFIKPPAGYQGTATEFQNQNINSQLRDPNSPMSQALARMNRGTAMARQAAIDRESIRYGNVPMSSENRRLAENNPVAYTGQSPSRGNVGTGSMPVNTSNSVGMNAANPNRAIPDGGAFGRNAPLGMGMQSFSVPATPLTRAEIERNMAMANQTPLGPNLDDMPPEIRARIQAESAIVNATNSAGEAIKGAAGRAMSTAKDVLSNAASYIPTGFRGEAGQQGAAGRVGGENIDNQSPEELQDSAEAALENRRNMNLNRGQEWMDLADSIGNNIEEGNYGYEDGLLGDAVDLGLGVTGDMYTASILGQSPALVKNALTGQYGAKSAVAMGRNDTLSSQFGKEARKQIYKATGESFAKGGSTLGGLARAGGTAAMQTAGKLMPYYSLGDAAWSAGEELLSDNGVRSTYHGGGTRGKAMGAASAALNGLTMGAYDAIAANYGPKDYAQKTGASKDPLGTAWLTEQIYNKFIK